MPRAWRPMAPAALLSLTLLWPAIGQTQPAGLPTASPSLALQTVAVQEPEGVLQWDAAWSLALSASPALAAAELEVQALGGGVTQAGLIPNPEIDMSIEDTANRATRSRTVQLNQLIELGGKRAARVGVAEKTRDVATAELQMVRQNLHATVHLAFVEVLLAQERVRLAQEAHELARRASEIVGRRVTAGKVSPVEATRARVEEGSARVEERQAQGELTSARQRLVATWGGREPRFTRAEGVLALPKLPNAEVWQARLAAAPSLLRAQVEVQQRAAMVELERSRRIPDVTVSVGSKRSEELGRNQTLVGVSIPLPLFDRNQGNVLEALRRADKSRSELRGMEASVSRDAGQAYARLNAARQEVEVLQQEVLPDARSAYQAASKGYELGKFAYLDVLDAQRTYFQTQFQFLRAMAEAHQAQADMERVLGVAEAASGPSQE